MSASLVLDNLEVAHTAQGSERLLSRVSLSVDPGEFVAQGRHGGQGLAGA